MVHSNLWDRYGEASADLTAEEIDEVLAMLEDPGTRRKPRSSRVIRIISRLGERSADTPRRHRRAVDGTTRGADRFRTRLNARLMTIYMLWCWRKMEP